MNINHCKVCGAVLSDRVVIFCGVDCADSYIGEDRTSLVIKHKRNVYGTLKDTEDLRYWKAFENMWNANRCEGKHVSSEFGRNYDGFKSFISAMGVVPKGMEAKTPCRSRIDHDIGYVPNNVLWCSWYDNNVERNKRVNIQAKSDSLVSKTYLDKSKVMFAMQEDMNSTVNSDWRTANYPWYRAIMIESCELMDHSDWCWWKKQHLDKTQAKLELIDILHFLISWWITLDGEYEGFTKLLFQFDELKYTPEKTLNESIEKLTLASSGQYFYGTVHGFWECMKHLDISYDEVFKMYIAKNILNIFRQEHGYKDGSYIKIWNGQEDNEVLATIMKYVDDTDEIMHQLESLYKVALNDTKYKGE